MGKVGRPKKQFTREQIDEARRLLGRVQYPSKVNARLREMFSDLNIQQAYNLIDVANREVYEQFAKGGDDLLVGTCLFLVSVMGDEAERTKDRISAAMVIARLLGMHKLIKQLQDAGDVDEFLAGVLSRRSARAGGTPAPVGPVL